MGWLFIGGTTKSDIIARLNEGWERNDGASVKTLANCVRGNVHWQLRETTYPTGFDGQPTRPAQRWIQCNLLGSHGDGYGWGYKDMDETCGPYEVNCPKSYLERVTPTDSAYAIEWRERCRAYHDRLDRIKALSVGDTIRFNAALSFGWAGEASDFVVRDKRRLWFKMPDGNTVRISKRTLAYGEWERVAAA